jgi:hypothetical protein
LPEEQHLDTEPLLTTGSPLLLELFVNLIADTSRLCFCAQADGACSGGFVRWRSDGGSEWIIVETNHEWRGEGKGREKTGGGRGREGEKWRERRERYDEGEEERANWEEWEGMETESVTLCALGSNAAGDYGGQSAHFDARSNAISMVII